MLSRKPKLLFGLFFMCLGSVCAASATGAEQEAGANGEAPAATAPNAAQAPSSEPGSVTPADQPAEPEQPAPSASQPDAQSDAPASNSQSEGENLFASDDNASEASAQGASADVPPGQEVEVGSFGQIDLHVKDLPLTKVLQLLSIQSRRNIVASREVSGKISADLYGVGFYEALNAILTTNGFGYEEKGNFIYVYTQQEIAARQEAQREIKTKVVRLNYITAADASAFVQPMLSSAGSISVSGEAADGMQPSLSDAGSNSYAHAERLVIHDYAENIEKIMSVVEQLDKRPKQVQIEATILQAELSEENAFGVDFALFTDLDVQDFTTPLGSVDELIDNTPSAGTSGGGGAGTPTTGTEADPTLKLGFLGSDAAVFIEALDTVTDTTVLARPQMLVLNRQRAELLVGGRVGFLSTTATDVSETQTVEFIETGTQLTVRPFVSDDGFVRLELRPTVTDATLREVSDTTIPDQTTQELTTNVMVRSGQTVVLGGLFKENTDVNRRQIPGVAEVPLLGDAFKGQSDTVSRSEVIFMIKPTIRKDEKLYAQARKAKADIELTRVGARDGLLPWANDRLTQSHMKKAYQYLRQGNEKKALWHTNLALHINPTLIEALRLKERISGKGTMVRDRGILEHAVDSMINEQMPQDQMDDDAKMDDNKQGAAAPVQTQPADTMQEAEEAEAAEAGDTPADDSDAQKSADTEKADQSDVKADAEADADMAQQADADADSAKQMDADTESASDMEATVQTVSDQPMDEAAPSADNMPAPDENADTPADESDQDTSDAVEQDAMSEDAVKEDAVKEDAVEADTVNEEAVKEDASSEGAADEDASMEAAMQSVMDAMIEQEQSEQQDDQRADDAQPQQAADDDESVEEQQATVQPASDTVSK